MYYVGCDLHKMSTWFYVMDEFGKKIASKSIANKPEELHAFLRSLSSPFELAVEATYNWYFFVDIAEQYAQKVYMADSYELKAFAKRHKKTDKIDARLIADVTRKGYLPEVTIVDKETRELRELLRYRINLVKDRTRDIARIKGILDKLGEDSRGDFTTGQKIRTKKLELGHLGGDYQKILFGYICKIESLNEKIRIAEKEIKGKAIEDRDTMNLMSLPGLKYFGSLLVKTEIADISRFDKFNRLCAYAGLAPKVHQSGNLSVAGSLMKNRRKQLRWILLETAQHFANADSSRKSKYERTKKKKGHNTAKVVLARDMLKVIYHILKEKRPYYRSSEKEIRIRAIATSALAIV